MKIDHIIFDCDSTLTRVEGVDELARWKGVYAQVSKLTDLAMDGKLDFAEALDQRLRLIQPTRSDLRKLGDLYIQEIVEGAEEAIKVLMAEHFAISIVSGGFRLAVAALADHLKIDPSHVYANELYFDEKGAYAGFDPLQPTAMEHGKASIARSIPGRKIIIGDGMSDEQAGIHVDAFVAFTGVRKRSAVVENADFELERFDGLKDILYRIETSPGKPVRV